MLGGRSKHLKVRLVANHRSSSRLPRLAIAGWWQSHCVPGSNSSSAGRVAEQIVATLGGQVHDVAEADVDKQAHKYRLNSLHYEPLHLILHSYILLDGIHVLHVDG